MLSSDTSSTDVVEQFSKAKQLLCEILKSAEIVKELDEHEGHPNAKLVYSKAPTLWLLILQRLLAPIAQRSGQMLLQEHADLLPQDNRRVAERSRITTPVSTKPAREFRSK